MTSQRKARLDGQHRTQVRVAYADFRHGFRAAFRKDPTSALEPHVRSAFRRAYPVWAWTREIQDRSPARYVLAEVHSSFLYTLSCLALGMPTVAARELRYACECILNYLYFVDHPRELQLAESGEDLWDVTRPRVLVDFLKRLPEYRSTAARQQLGELYTLYKELSAYSHPTRRVNFGLLRYLSQVECDAESGKRVAQLVQRAARIASVLFFLRFPSRYAAAPELSQFVFRHAIGTDLLRRLAHP